MKTIKFLFTVLVAMLLAVSCEKEEPVTELTDLNGTVWEYSETDTSGEIPIVATMTLSFYQSTAVLRGVLSDGKDVIEVSNSLFYSYDSVTKKGKLASNTTSEQDFSIDGDKLIAEKSSDMDGFVMTRKK